MFIAPSYDPAADVILYQGDCLDLLRGMPDSLADLVVTSPPYNVGKEYERRVGLDAYVEQQRLVIRECARVVAPHGSICWQVGNFVGSSEIVPLDILLFPIFRELGFKLRNRIVWHFGHGLHASKRFSGRYEVVLWFTKTDQYVFNLDDVRVPQKYPNKKHFKGENRGSLSCNPLGKNPSDVWEIPNVKSNHIEKTNHPCQFPVELVERLVLALSRPNGWVVDPYMGVGTTAVAALMHNRRAAGADLVEQYLDTAKRRLEAALNGSLLVRPMERPVYDPKNPRNVAPRAVNLSGSLFEKPTDA